jgi:AcrR family transcriptional regulator
MVRISARAKEATRARLLAAAAHEFGRAGLERANVDAISVAAGYGKGTVYNYFSSKEELFLAVVQEASAQATAMSTAPAGADARERISALLAGFCGWAAENEAFARVLVRECLMGTPGLYPRVIRAEDPLVGELEAIIRDGAARGELRSDIPPGLLALAVSGMADLALAQNWASGGARPQLAEIPGLILALLFGSQP